MADEVFNGECEAFGVGYCSTDNECQTCDEAVKCELESNLLLRREPMALSKKGQEAKQVAMEEVEAIKKKAALLEWLAENEFDVEIRKTDTRTVMLSKISDFLTDYFADVKDEDSPTEDDIDGNELDGDPDFGEGTFEKSGFESSSTEDKGSGEYDPADLEARIKALEERVSALVELLKASKSDPVPTPNSGKKTTDDMGSAPSSRKMTPEQKEILKKKLLAGLPYVKKELVDMSGKHLKILGSAMGLKTFGETADKTRAQVFAAQKKWKPAA